MDLLKLNLSNILRYRLRSFLSLVAITCSVAVFFSVLSLSKGFKKGVEKERQRVGIDFVVASGSCPHELASLLFYGSVPASFLDESLVRVIRKTKGLTFASPMIVVNVPAPRPEDKILIYGYEMPTLRKIKPEWVINGEIPIGWDAIAEGRVLVGSDFAEKYGLKVGDSIKIPALGRDLPVSGIIQKTFSNDDAFIYAPLMLAQRMALKFSGREVIGAVDITCSPKDKITADPVSAIAVRVDDPATIPAISAELERNIPGIQIVTMSQATGSIANLVASINALGFSASIIALIVASAGLASSILMTVLELTSEFGMMRAIGASRGDIFKIVISESVLLTAAGGIAGIAVALLGSSAIEWLVHKFIVYTPGSRLISFDPVIAMWCVASSIALGALAGLYPAWKASRVNPIEAIRNN